MKKIFNKTNYSNKELFDYLIEYLTHNGWKKISVVNEGVSYSRDGVFKIYSTNPTWDNYELDDNILDVPNLVEAPDWFKSFRFTLEQISHFEERTIFDIFWDIVKMDELNPELLYEEFVSKCSSLNAHKVYPQWKDLPEEDKEGWRAVNAQIKYTFSYMEL